MSKPDAPRLSVVPDERKDTPLNSELCLELELEHHIAAMPESQRVFLQSEAGRRTALRKLSEVTPLLPLLSRISEVTHDHAARLDVERGRSIAEAVLKKQIESACESAFLEAQNQVLSDEVRQLRALIKIDPLTELPNRRGYDEAAKDAMKLSVIAGLPLYCFMTDIDDFRHVNNEYGHLAGDAALKEVSVRLRHQTRVNDFVGRFGGEEFVSLVFADQDGALSIAQRVVNSIGHKSFSVDTKSGGVKRLNLTVSIGGSRFRPEDPDPKTTMQERADENLYEAKRAGKNCAFVDGEQVRGNLIRLVKRKR